MRILQVLPDLSAGGAEGFITNLGVSLAQLGTQVAFFLMAGVRDERGDVLLSRLQQAGIKVVGAHVHNVRSPMNLVQLWRLINTWRPSIVQANLYTAEVLVGAAMPLCIARERYFVRRLADTRIPSHRSHTVVRLMDRVFRQTFACSSPVEHAYRAFMHGKHKSELITIPNGGLLRLAIPTDDEKRRARANLGISTDAFVIAHIGGMRASGAKRGLERSQKAHDVLLKAFARAFGDQADCHLVLLGDGPLRPDVEALAKSLGIFAQTHFVGRQPEPWPVLEAADAFCFPSRYEGSPNVLPEAGSCGLPVIASDIPEIRSLYPSAGWLLKQADDVEAFADGLRQTRENYAHFRMHAELVAPAIRKDLSMTTCASRYLDSYRSAFNAPRKLRDQVF